MNVLSSTVRHAIDSYDLEEWHIECRLADGQKGAFITVDIEYPELADLISTMLNSKAKYPETFMADIVASLSGQYSIAEVNDMLDKAEFVETSDCMKVIYDNGVVDTFVKVTKTFLIHENDVVSN